MIVIDQTIISDDIIRETFVCNLSACKGSCCEAGDMGAPLTDEEAKLLSREIDLILPFLSDAGRKAIGRQGVAVTDAEGDTSTPLVVENGACAYAVKDLQGVWKCGIELAHEASASTLQKPISCHLYPIRLKQYEHYVAVNYHQWEVCSPACALGKTLNVKIFEFLKVPLIRKFGEEWYQALEAAAKEYGAI